MGFFKDTKEKMRLLGIAIAEETTTEKLNSRITKIENQKIILNENLNLLLNDIGKIKRKIEKQDIQISLLNDELKSNIVDEKQIENAILSQKQKMQSLVNRYNSLTKEEKILRKYFGEIQ